MAIDIQEFKDDELFINDKLVIQDSNGNWCAKVELTQAENKALQKHLRHKHQRM